MEHMALGPMLGYTLLLTGARTVAMHPLSLVLARQMTNPQEASLGTFGVLSSLSRLGPLGASRMANLRRELRRGLAANVIGCALGDVLFIGVFEPFKHMARSSDEGLWQFFGSDTGTAVGGFAGDAISRIVHAPTQLVMTKQVLEASRQFEHHLHNSATTTAPLSVKCAATTAPHTVEAWRVRSSIAAILGKVVRTEGVPGLFRGLTVSVAAFSMWSAMWWWCYEATKEKIYFDAMPRTSAWIWGGATSPLAPSSSKGCAGEQERITTTNGGVEVHRHHQGDGDDEEAHLPEGSRKLLHLMCHHASDLLPGWATDLHDNWIVNSFASAIASATTAVIFNPAFVVRTRQQQRSINIRAAIRSVLAEGGARGFMAGAQLSMVSCVVDGIAMSFTYELAKKWADQR